MDREAAEACVDAIFDDLRDRKFLKWLFAEDPENCAPILYELNGQPLMALKESVQDEIWNAWVEILMKSRQ